MALLSPAACTLLVSQWHGPFYGLSAGDSLPVLRLLDSVGFTSAGSLAFLLEKNPAAVQQAQQAILSRSKDEGGGGKHKKSEESEQSDSHWVQDFFFACASKAGSEASLSCLLEQMQTEKSKFKSKLKFKSSPLSLFFAELADSIVKTGNSAKEVENTPFSSVFSLNDLSTAAALVDAVEKEKRKKTFAEAKLYAALCLYSYFSTVPQLAKLLTVYINQEDETVLKILARETVKKGDGEKNKNNKKREIAGVRAKGVVAGLLECALAVAQSAPSALKIAFFELQEPLKREKEAMLPLIGPRPEQTKALLTSAALVLAQLSIQATQLKTAASSSMSTLLVDGVSVGKEILHTMQELLFTIVLGAGTVDMSNRPARNQPISQLSDSVSACVVVDVVVTHRPLTLHEVDAITHDIFPSLLQQLGYEWPWSELLRHCRALDKLQFCPVFPYTAQSSALMMETLLLNLSERTYPQRLENLLPESFDKLREKLGLLPAMSRSSDAVNGEESPSDKTVERLFIAPVYYREPVEALLSYYKQTKLGRLRVEEAERVLAVAVSALPMTVQLRALAPREEDEDGNDNNDNGYHGVNSGSKNGKAKGEDANAGKPARSYLLSNARVTALETRYKMECLLTSVVVQTQLETHSQVQGMMRELTPLFTKLALILSRNVNALAVPLLVQRESEAAGEAPLVFSAEAERLINDTGYQFYPLEWLPALACSFHERQERQHRNRDPNDLLISSAGASTVSFPYSVFAAVAHQLNASFHSPLGSGVGYNKPAGFRASLATAPASPVYLSGQAAADAGGGDAMHRLKRATRLLESLMLPCWLDARLSSCDLEGTMAVTTTRAVVGGSSSKSGGGSGGGYNSGRAGGGEGDAGDGVLARLSHLLKPRVLEQFWNDESGVENNDNEENGITSRADGDGGAGSGSSRKRDRDLEHMLVDKDEEAVRALANALLRQGASSFALAMEAKDFVAVIAQCFLPSSANLSPASGTKSAKARASNALTEELLRSANSWCQATVGGNAARADIRMQLQQRQQPLSGGKPVSFDDVFASIYNSCTFDSCALARRVLFAEVPARLLEKLRLRQQQTADLNARRDRCIRLIHNLASSEEDVGTGPTAAAKDEVDRLLMHQWSQYAALLRNLGFASPTEDEVDGHAVSGGGDVDRAPALSAAQWVWYSPYSAN